MRAEATDLTADSVSEMCSADESVALLRRMTSAQAICLHGQGDQAQTVSEDRASAAKVGGAHTFPTLSALPRPRASPSFAVDQDAQNENVSSVHTFKLTASPGSDPLALVARGLD